MGRDVAAALGVTTRRDGYLAGAHDLVTWCVGHVVELDEPEAYDPTWKQWRMEDLPIFPDTFTYHPCAKTRDQFTVITHLLKRTDVTTIVNAADAGREGELIFDLVYTLARRHKPVDRLWLSSLTRRAILTAVPALAIGGHYRGLRELRALPAPAVLAPTASTPWGESRHRRSRSSSRVTRRSPPSCLPSILKSSPISRSRRARTTVAGATRRGAVSRHRRQPTPSSPRCGAGAAQSRRSRRRQVGSARRCSTISRAATRRQHPVRLPAHA
jgi:hypothetical protein